ncbi:MAG: basic secretory family protein [Actinomycetota bacterium]|nr:basic secretory family protein [Actinomycetota bacterium]
MLTVRRGPLVRLLLVGILLSPAVSVARASSPCALLFPSVSAPDFSLGADVDLACSAVLAVVPSWDGRAVVQVVDGDDGVAAETLGATVSVHRRAWATLTAAGRQEVLTHELVHVATDAFTTARTPGWLVEGLAEAVALRSLQARGIGLADRVVAQELAVEVARGHLPQALPTAQDFERTAALAYQESWLAADLLLRRFGDAGVLRLYREPARIDVAWLVAALPAEIVRRLS